MSPTRPLRLAIALFVVTVAACTPEGPPSAADGDCSDGLYPQILSFVDSYNSGPPRAAADHFAEGHRFEWYSVNEERLSTDAENRSTLEDYFEAQIEAGDGLEDPEVLWFAFDPPRDVVHFQFLIMRTGVEYIGKGALSCMDERFVVWAMGPNVIPDDPRRGN